MIRDLPAIDPGLPRFAYVVAAGALVAAGWVLVSGGAAPPAAGAVPVRSEGVASTASGVDLYISAGCADCHPTAGPSTSLGPSLAGALARAAARIAEPTYAGRAQTAEEYLVEATLDHCMDVVPGYSCGSVPDIGLALTVEQASALARYVAGLPGGGGP